MMNYFPAALSDDTSVTCTLTVPPAQIYSSSCNILFFITHFLNPVKHLSFIQAILTSRIKMANKENMTVSRSNYDNVIKICIITS